MKKKNQELEKYKFVLSYKITELRKQIEPREKDIRNYKEQIQEVRGSFLPPKTPQLYTCTQRNSFSVGVLRSHADAGLE